MNIDTPNIAMYFYLLSFLFTFPAGAVDKSDPSTLSPKKLTAIHFDHPKLGGNGNGRIDFKEFINLHLRKQSPTFNALDQNKDFQISPDETKIWAEDFGYDFFPHNTEISFEDADSTYKPSSPKPISVGKSSTGLGQLRLGKSYEDLLKPVAKSSLATFGFYRDETGNQTTRTIEGTFGLVRRLDDPSLTSNLWGYTIDKVSFVPAITINEVTGTAGGTKKEIDSAVLRLGFGFEYRNDSLNKSDTWLDAQTVVVNFRKSGTTEWDNTKNALELTWEPTRNRLGDLLSLNGPYRAFSSDPNVDPEKETFLYRMTTSMKLETGESVDALDNGSFLKLGPSLGLSFRPNSFPRAELFISSSYFWELKNDSENFDYQEAGVRVSIDKSKQFFIEIKYRDGQIPANYSDIDLLQLTLSTKI